MGGEGRGGPHHVTGRTVAVFQLIREISLTPRMGKRKCLKYVLRISLSPKKKKKSTPVQHLSGLCEFFLVDPSFGPPLWLLTEGKKRKYDNNHNNNNNNKKKVLKREGRRRKKKTVRGWRVFHTCAPRFQIAIYKCTRKLTGRETSFHLSTYYRVMVRRFC